MKVDTKPALDGTGRTDQDSFCEETEVSPTRKSRKGNSPANKCPNISYEAFVWTIYLVFTALAVTDRFTTNVWPRQTFSIGSGSAGSDRLVGYKPGPWSVIAYDVLARISGRFAISAFNLLLITRLRSLETYLASSWIGNHVLDCTNIVKANIRLHTYNAIALTVLTLLHVYSILLPCLTHRWSAQVVPGNFEWILSERTPPGFKDANPETETMSLQVDDVFRMVEMTIVLGILTPLSVRWLARKHHIGIHVHRFVMIIYFVDIVRRHSHPHSWVLNTPIFVIWLLDKVWSSFWHRSKSPTFHRLKLGPDYMVLFWKQGGNQAASNTVGPDYFLRLNDSSVWEPAHVFTAFENRIELMDNGKGLFPRSSEWTAASVIRVFHNKRVPNLCFSNKDRISHTHRIYNVPKFKMQINSWGPCHGEMSDKVRRALQGTYGSKIALVAAGSGINYILDACQWLDSCAGIDLTILFTTRDSSLYEWTSAVLQRLLQNRDVGVGPGSCASIRVLMALTKPGANPTNVHGKDAEAQMSAFSTVTITCTSRRIDFESELPHGSIVFCQGSQGLKDAVAKASKKNSADYFSGRGGRL